MGREKMLFKKEMANKIYLREKTETRRLQPEPRYKAGSIQPIQENYHDKAKGHIKILEVYKQKLKDMTQKNAVAEGFINLNEYYRYLALINRKSLLKKLGIQAFLDKKRTQINPAMLELEPVVYVFELVSVTLEFFYSLYSERNHTIQKVNTLYSNFEHLTMRDSHAAYITRKIKEEFSQYLPKEEP